MTTNGVPPSDIWCPEGSVKTLVVQEEDIDKLLIDLQEKPVQKMPISFLQELCAKRKVTPIYEMLASEGQVHEPTFIYRVIIDDITGIGKGKSKKMAKHNAAKAALERIVENDRYTEWLIPGTSCKEAFDYLHSVIPEIGAATPTSAPETAADPETDQGQGLGEDGEGGPGNPVGKLQEMCAQKKFPPPMYDLIEESGMPHDKTFVMKVSLGNFEETGTARSKKVAKRIASELMLKFLATIPDSVRDELTIEDNQDDENDANAVAPDSELDAQLSSFANEQLMLKNAEANGDLEHEEETGREERRLNDAKSGLDELMKTDFGADKPSDKHKEMLQRIGDEQGWTVVYTNLDRTSKDGKRQCLVSFGDNSVCHGTGDTLQEAEYAAAYSALDLVKMVTTPK